MVTSAPPTETALRGLASCATIVHEIIEQAGDVVRRVEPVGLRGSVDAGRHVGGVVADDEQCSPSPDRPRRAR